MDEGCLSNVSYAPNGISDGVTPLGKARAAVGHHQGDKENGWKDLHPRKTNNTKMNYMNHNITQNLHNYRDFFAKKYLIFPFKCRGSTLLVLFLLLIYNVKYI